MSQLRRIFVAGHRGLVGAATVRRLAADPEFEILTVERAALDLRDAAAVRAWMERARPHAVVLAAARVGGIWANQRQPVDFLLDNLKIQNAVIESAHAVGVDRLIFLGSSCIYPKFAAQPIREEALLTGALEPTNEPYAIAKIAGLKLCSAYRRQYGADFRVLMPTNLYGPGDNFDLETSHVVPALLRKFHEAKVAGRDHVTLWGTGRPQRELLHVDDLADAIHRVLREARAEYEAVSDGGELALNVGTGVDLSIAELAQTVAEVVGFRGEVRWDNEKPDGTPRKCLDVRRIRTLGWRHRIDLREGLHSTYSWYLLHNSAARGVV